jgi:hypothetical protein
MIHCGLSTTFSDRDYMELKWVLQRFGPRYDQHKFIASQDSYRRCYCAWDSERRGTHVCTIGRFRGTIQCRSTRGRSLRHTRDYSSSCCPRDYQSTKPQADFHHSNGKKRCKSVLGSAAWGTRTSWNPRPSMWRTSWNGSTHHHVNLWRWLATKWSPSMTASPALWNSRKKTCSGYIDRPSEDESRLNCRYSGKSLITQVSHIICLYLQTTVDQQPWGFGVLRKGARNGFYNGFEEDGGRLQRIERFRYSIACWWVNGGLTAQLQYVRAYSDTSCLVLVTRNGVSIDNWIYWTLTNSKYKQI